MPDKSSLTPLQSVVKGDEFITSLTEVFDTGAPDVASPNHIGDMSTIEPRHVHVVDVSATFLTTDQCEEAFLSDSTSTITDIHLTRRQSEHLPEQTIKASDFSATLSDDSTSFKTSSSTALVFPDDGVEKSVESFVSPTCPAMTQILDVKPNQVARFVCHTELCSFSDVEWFHNGKRLGNAERIKSEQKGSVLSLFIYNIRPEDQGIYSCAVQNKDGTSWRTSALLSVKGGYSPCDHAIPE